MPARVWYGGMPAMDDLLTTRQLQDLLQVDRITIYRMLDDGRLRGFKVGGQWRFSRRDIEAWLRGQQSGPAGPPPAGLLDETSALAETAPCPEPGAQLLPLTCIRAIQAVCAEALDVAAVTVDLDGTPLSGVSNSCDYCNLILSTEEGRRRCGEAWRRASQGQVQPCHAGLLVAGAPISVNGRPVAVTAVCQFVTLWSGSSEPSWAARLPGLARDLALPENELRAAAGCLRVIPDSQVARVVALTGRMALTFEEIAQERMNLLGRLEKIAEMSKL